MASILNVEAQNSEVWVSDATFEMDDRQGRGISQGNPGSVVHVEGTHYYVLLTIFINHHANFKLDET